MSYMTAEEEEAHKDSLRVALQTPHMPCHVRQSLAISGIKHPKTSKSSMSAWQGGGKLCKVPQLLSSCLFCCEQWVVTLLTEPSESCWPGFALESLPAGWQGEPAVSSHTAAPVVGICMLPAWLCVVVGFCSEHEAAQGRMHVGSLRTRSPV